MWYSLAIALSPFAAGNFRSSQSDRLPRGLEHRQNLPREQSQVLHLVRGPHVAAGTNYDHMIEAEFRQRLEALHTMSGWPRDSEPIDKRVVDELRVASVCSRVPRHIVRFANFLRHRAIVGTHPGCRIARHPREMSDYPNGPARHLTSAGNIRMHHHVQKCAELERRGIQSGLLTSLPSMADCPCNPFRIGTNCKGYRIGECSPNLDHTRPGSSDVDRHLRQSPA